LAIRWASKKLFGVAKSRNRKTIAPGFADLRILPNSRLLAAAIATAAADHKFFQNEKTPQNTEVLRGFSLVVRAGLEPATPAFSVQCSTN